MERPAFKHVSSFKDRHGRVRAYLRVPGKKPLSLPAPIGGEDFIAAYNAAMGSIDKLPDAAGKPHARAIQSRFNKAVRETMAESGVYILIHNGAISYIGSSKNCAKRISEHRTNGRPFDKAFFIFAEADDRLPLERMLISAIAPEGNKTLPPLPTQISRKLGKLPTPQ